MECSPRSAEVAAAIRLLIRKRLAPALSGGGYTERLFCQDILEAPPRAGGLVAEAGETILRHFTERDPDFPNGPFNSLIFALAERSGSSRWRDRFAALAEQALEAPCSSEGAWLHPRGRFGDGGAVLIDSFQEEASRLVRLAGWRRKEGKEVNAGELEAEAVRQFRIHRRILLNPSTGLWHNGRGWNSGDPSALSPGAWSRGHGWLLRGLVDTCARLEEPALRMEAGNLLLEISGTLVSLRNADGLWPVLLNRRAEGSPSETSGSALIAAAILRARRYGMHMPSDAVDAAFGAARRILKQTEEGEIPDVSPGPGPLVEERPYLTTDQWNDTSHGAFAVLEALLELVAAEVGMPRG